jgi:NADH:ubiquinone oxidoreductase subunit 5 (subunit L)/multisubunit Na+/H+ antiporter MnhA subunit
MYLLVLYFPLISSICCGFLGHFLGKNGAIKFALICMFISIIIAFCIFIDIVLNEQVVVIPIIDFIDVYGITIY